MEHFIHPDFQLNGKNFDYIDLIAEANNLYKNGTLFEKGIGSFLLKWLNNEEYIFVQTSGSTGVPKQIYIPKSAMIASAKATGSFFNLQAQSSALLCLSADYIAGKMMLVRAMVLGLKLDYVEPSSQPLAGIYKKYNFVAMVPMQIEASFEQLNQITILIIGGAKLNSKLAAKLKDVSTNVYETYGMTETVSHIALKKISEDYFSVLPNIKIGIDERQCLVIEAPLLYAEKIITNDSVEIINDNQFILKGRIDNIINSGGIKIFPEELEEKLSLKIDQRFFFTSQLDERLGEQLILIVEGTPFAISNNVFDDFSKYQIPKAIYFVDQFVETGNGKINRNLTKAKLFP